MTNNSFNTQIVIDEFDINSRLDNMSLNLQDIIQLSLDALLVRTECTNYNTKGAPGYLQWDAMVRRLRECFCFKHWEKYEDNGVEGIFNKNKKIKLIPSSGNAGTGIKTLIPSNKNPKGFKTIELINNSTQGNLFTGYNTQIDDDNSKLYILLYYSNNKELRLEVSKPSYINKSGIIEAWEERIIIPPILLDGVSIKRNTSNNPSLYEEIDIPVIRK